MNTAFIPKAFALAAALAAFSLPARAGTSGWFDAGIAGYESWPSDGSDKVVENQGAWSGTGNATLDAARHVLQVNASAGGALVFTPAASCDAAGELVEQVVFVSTNVLADIQPLARLAPLDAEKKGSLAAAIDGATTNFYGWAKDPDGATNVWRALSGATPAVGEEIEIRILFKTVEGALQVQYQADGTALAADGADWLPVVAANTELAHAGMRGGDLEVASLYAFTVETEVPPPPEPVTAVLTLAELPANVSLVSVATNSVAIEPVEGAYTVLSNATVAVTFAPDEGYRLVGDATVEVVMDGDTELDTADMPTAELIPPPVLVTLTIPELPANVSLVSVTTNGVAVAGAEGAYTVLSNATVVATFAAAQGYALVGDAEVTVVVDGDMTLSGIPEAALLSSFVRINEIMASNPSVEKGGIASELGIAEMDWIELYNGSSQDIDATGWYLTDNDKKGKETKATILGSCVIPAGGYKIVWLDKTHVDPAEYGPTEAFAVIKLSSGGDLIKLSDADVNFVDKIDFTTKPQIKGYSYGPGTVTYGPLVGTGPYVYMKTATPGAPNVAEGWGDFTPAVTFSEPHGYKTEAFDLTLSCADMPDFEGAAIYYTLDGSSPAPGASATHLYTEPIAIAKTTVVRAAVPIEGSILQFDTSATYVYLDDVLPQGRTTSQPTGIEPYFPNTGVNGQKMLYGMLQLTGEERERLLRGFTNSIATLSVVVDPQNLFNSTTGIYVNAKGEGEAWERQIMLEGFDPTGVGADFGQPAGIRIRGGNSRQGNHAKHALRFFFRSSYGVSSLKAKMFPGEPVKEAGEYDKLDLRCSQNISWAYNETTAGNDKKDTFVTEVFSRDSQRDLGQPYTRSRYYNLFINGQYWGLYQTQERGDEHFGESYLGGDSLQYDLIKASSTYASGSLGYLLECNEGTWDAWESLRSIAIDEGFAGDHADNYMRILGRNPDGTRNPAYPILLNQESLMAFMLVTHFVVDRDGPTSPFSGIDKGHVNNFYALRNRNDAGDVNGFVFLRHDAEISMGQHTDCEANDNPTLWGTEAFLAKHRDPKYFNPAELHYLLMQNPEYKRAYADYFYKECLREGGAMTVEKATERYVSRMNELTDAIVCEQARWAQNGQTRDTWLDACKTSTTFITNRVGNMKSQYQTQGWYPSIEPPTVVNATGDRYFDGGEVPYHEKVYLASTVADGTIYYTTNGVDDPMDAGVAYTGAFDIPDTGFTVLARVLKAGEWSALEEVALEADVPNDQRYGVRIAAVLNAAVNDPADEFIVLTNILDRAVSLEGLSIWSEKAGKALTKLTAITNAIELAAGGAITLTRAEYWPDPTETIKLKNGEIYVELRDFNGKRIQNAHVDSEKWFPTDPTNPKSGACNKTGRWFVALEFLGDTEGGEVTDVSQWAPSPEAFPISYELGLEGATNAVANPDSYTADDLPLALLPAGCEGWMFLGWTNRVSALPTNEIPVGTTGAITNWGVWLRNAFTVTFEDEDGTELSSAEYAYGTAAADIEQPETPTKASTEQYMYTFAGWTPAIEDVTSNATYTATYKAWTIVAVPTAVTGLEYDGTAQTGIVADTGYALTGNVATNAGAYEATATLDENYVWSDGSFDPTNIVWSIERLYVEIRAASAEKVYDGTPLATNGWTLAIGRLAAGDSIASVEITGSQTDVGSSENAATNAVVTNAVGAVVTGNYEIVYHPGTLTVLANDTFRWLEIFGIEVSDDGSTVTLEHEIDSRDELLLYTVFTCTNLVNPAWVAATNSLDYEHLTIVGEEKAEIELPAIGPVRFYAASASYREFEKGEDLPASSGEGGTEP